MPATSDRRNRGPAAAAANRAALIAAGRRLFAERGYQVALSAVAREAGVSQGVLYRHFPTRVSLALAVFSENIDEVEALAMLRPGPDTLGSVVARLIDLVVESAAFVDVVVHGPASADWADGRRLAELLAAPLALAQRDGRARSDLTPDDLMLLVRMAYGVVVTRGETAARDEVRRALQLVDPALAGALASAESG
ncbi:MAG: helix-turn-helix domain-containing protein, partial [Propioniciclava sp.]